MNDIEVNLPNPENKIIKKRKVVKNSMSLIMSIVVLIAVVASGFGVFYMNKIGLIKLPKPAPKVQNQAPALTEDQAVLLRLKQIMLLPEGVTPNMAVILDVETLKSKQPDFFSNAKNGDRLILYPDMAIIYDVQANKIIKIGPVVSSNPANVSSKK
jgi:hypothetical protein